MTTLSDLPHTVITDFACTSIPVWRAVTACPTLYHRFTAADRQRVIRSHVKTETIGVSDDESTIAFSVSRKINGLLHSVDDNWAYKDNSWHDSVAIDYELLYDVFVGSGAYAFDYGEDTVNMLRVSFAWYRFDVLHRDGDRPAFVCEYIKPEYYQYELDEMYQIETVYSDQCTYDISVWYNNGQIHRDGDRPAIVYADGRRKWYRNGRLHRDGDQPAVIVPVGSTVSVDAAGNRIEKEIVLRQWWTDGILQRESE